MTSKHDDDTNADEKNSTPYPEIVEQENPKLNGSLTPNKDSEIAGPLDGDKGVKGTEVHYHDLANTNGNTLTPSSIKSTPDIHSSVTTDTFSDASQTFWGYIDAQKITQRTGIAIKNLPKFSLKEVLDNGCDEEEDNSSSSNSITVNSLQPKVTTWITKESKDILRIVTRNTNYGNKKTFDRARLNAIFNYDNFHSSKLNQYKVTRGALGDAMKEWPTISYALINNNISATEDKQWNHPLIIRHNKTEFKIKTQIDRSIKRIIPNIEEVHDESIDNYTEVEFKLPIIPEMEDKMSLWNFWLYCTKYVLWSIHITFEFHLSYDNRDLTIDIPATQAISSTFVNTNSIYGYSLREFENFIYNIHDTKQTIYDGLVNRKFREDWVELFFI